MIDNGLAIAILTAMALILLVGLLIGFFASKIIVRRFGWTGAKRNFAYIALLAIGCGGSALAVIATFYESAWSPPPQITFDVPPGFLQSWVIVLEDPKANPSLVWTGVELPFSGKSTRVSVPLHGILRVQSLDTLSGRMDITVKWSDGVSSVSQAGGPAPKSTGAILFTAFNRDLGNGTPSAEPPFGDTEALGAYISKQENATP
jgi:hypothetical protein